MSEYKNKTQRKVEQSSENEGEEFVPRFVKVFNQSKTYGPTFQGRNTQSIDSYRTRVMNEVIMPPSKAEIKMTTLQYQPVKEQKKSWREGIAMSIDKSTLCDRPSMRMSHNNDSRKKIVRTNTDSEILIPKVEETEDPFQSPPLDEIPDHGDFSIVKLKGQLPEGKLRYSYNGGIKNLNLECLKI